MGETPGIGGSAGGLWYRVQAVSANSVAGTAQADYASVLPAVLNAARLRRSFIAGWLARGGGAPLELITNAGPLPPPGKPAPADAPGAEAEAPAQPATGEAVQLLFPWGARGVAIEGNMIADLDQLVWAPCPGRQVVRAEPAPQAAAPAPARDQPTLFESALQTLLGRPFGWLVVADPTDQLTAEAADLRSQLTVLRQYDQEDARFDADRLQQRLAELDAYREAGLWHVRALVGAATEADLRLIAPLLVGSADLTAHPYRLRCPDGAQEFADVLAARVSDPADGSAVPFAATAGALVALTGLPRREVPGVRVMRPGYFDVTGEAGTGRSVELGKILDGEDREVGALRVPLTTLNRHALVTGASGAGKSQTVRHLLEQLTAAGIGWLVVEPVKAEYAAMAVRLAAAGQDRDSGPGAGTGAGSGAGNGGEGTGPDTAATPLPAAETAGRAVTVINPADPESVPLSINPLAPEPGYPVQAHIDMVRALFLAAFDAHEPFPQIMAQALQRVYEDCGWDPVTGAGRADAAVPPAVPTLARLQEAALAVIDDVGYGRELRADMRGFVQVRLRSLRTGSAGRFFEGGHPADVSALLARNVVLELEDIANDEDKAFVIGTLIIRLVEHLRLQRRGSAAAGSRADSKASAAAGTRAGPKASPADELRHVLVLEEAHRLLRAGREGASAHAVELFAGLLAEIRAYGEGIVIAEQIPAKLVPDAVKNTALKVLHRLPAADDRQLVGAAMNLDEDQSRQVVSLPPGEAAVFTDGMDRPMRVRVPFGGDREVSPAAVAGADDGDLTGNEPAPLPLPPLLGRRSAACGPACTGGRPCTLVEIRAADLLAASPSDAWIRVWSEVYVLAHLTNRPRPRVPVALRERWAGLEARLRECLLATTIEQAVERRAQVLRAHFDPGSLAAACAASAADMLDGGKGAGTMPGTSWVIPQLRWLHELERLCPLGVPAPDPFAAAPALDYALSELADRPGIKIGQRISELRRHPLSMEVDRNRLLAWTALLGDDDQAAFIADLAAVAIGVSHRGQLGKAAGEMGVTGWLEAVLSWPRRFIVGADDQLSPRPLPEPNPVAG